MRVLILAIALMALTLPAFADCPVHEAAKSDTIAKTNAPPAPAPAPPSGG